MAFTYLVVNIVFCAAIVGMIVRNFQAPTRTWWLTLIVLLVLTAIFDNFIIWAGIVGYNSTKILNIYIGNAPIEDFFYAFLSVIIVPALWKRFKQ